LSNAANPANKCVHPASEKERKTERQLTEKKEKTERSTLGKERRQDLDMEKGLLHTKKKNKNKQNKTT
jgi:hypothetical protein